MVVDHATVEHLNRWLENQIADPNSRAAVRSEMLAVVADDPDYWTTKTWWQVYDEAEKHKDETQLERINRKIKQHR